tara:strand:- start:431 stop:628 length:198 start_codon:yes stop_codon:yes gene_type:complete
MGSHSDHEEGEVKHDKDILKTNMFRNRPTKKSIVTRNKTTKAAETSDGKDRSDNIYFKKKEAKDD